MRIKFEGDADSLKQVGQKLQSSPSTLDELTADPQKFLKQFGLEVDDETAKAIQARARQGAGASAAPGAVVHIDI